MGMKNPGALGRTGETRNSRALKEAGPIYSDESWRGRIQGQIPRWITIPPMAFFGGFDIDPNVG